MLDRRIVQDFGLEQGVTLFRPEAQAIISFGDGQSMALFDDMERTKGEISRFSAHDAQQFENYAADLDLAGNVYQEILSSEEILSRNEFRDHLNEHHAGLGSRFVDGSLRQALSYYFSDPSVQAALGGTSFLYNFSPDDVGTAFALLYLAQFRAGGTSGWAFYPGGMGALMEKMAMRLAELGGVIRFNQKVTGIIVKNGKASTVKCEGDVYNDFDLVVSGYPFERLIFEGGSAPKPAIADGVGSKINLLLERPIEFDLKNTEHAQFARETMFVFCPSLDYMSRAYQSAQKQGYSENPYFEIVQPSVADKSLSCGKHHLASMYCMFSAYSSFASDRRVLDKWQAHLRDIFRRNGIRFPEGGSSEFLDPVNLEQKFGLVKGNVDHGNLSPENSFNNRAVILGRPYATPYDNVYMCGSSQFPGGEVTGVPGRRAAELILSNSKA